MKRNFFSDGVLMRHLVCLFYSSYIPLSRYILYDRFPEALQQSVRNLSHSLMKGEVLIIKRLILAIFAFDVTTSAVPTNHSIVYMPFQRNTTFVYM